MSSIAKIPVTRSPIAKNVKEERQPVVLPDYCKACGRCIEACNKDCITLSSDINPATGLHYAIVDLDQCNSCGLCLSACPEPYGMKPKTYDFDALEAADLPEARNDYEPAAADIPDEILPLADTEPLVIRGTYASAIGALVAGCRHFYGYPITPSTEGAELMAKLLPQLEGVFVQAISEVATINMMFGCGAAGKRSLTFTSSPGFSLMLEGLSYMIGAEVPAVVVNVMRGGPGLGNIAPEQADIKLACRGLGHGNTHGIVLAPSTPQEMLDLTILAFDLAFKYRNPVIVVCDGYLGQMTGRVTLPRQMVKPGLPGWAVWGDAAHRPNLVSSIHLTEADLEMHNQRLGRKYAEIREKEQRADVFQCDDADVVLVACNTPSRMAKGAVRELRERGVRAGLFRPLTLWPFPVDLLVPVLRHAKRVVVIEAGHGQLEDEMRLALSHANVVPPGVCHVQHEGGVLPQAAEIVARVMDVSQGAPDMTGGRP